MLGHFVVQFWRLRCRHPLSNWTEGFLWPPSWVFSIFRRPHSGHDEMACCTFDRWTRGTESMVFHVSNLLFRKAPNFQRSSVRNGVQSVFKCSQLGPSTISSSSSSSFSPSPSPSPSPSSLSSKLVLPELSSSRPSSSYPSVRSTRLR